MKYFLLNKISNLLYMSCLFSTCGNLCAFFSCYADAKNAITKLLPCFRKKRTRTNI